MKRKRSTSRNIATSNAGSKRNSKEARELMIRRKLRPWENLPLDNLDIPFLASSNDDTINNNLASQLQPPIPTSKTLSQRPLPPDTILSPQNSVTCPVAAESSLQSDDDYGTTATATTDLLCDDEIAYAAIFLEYGHHDPSNLSG